MKKNKKKYALGADLGGGAGAAIGTAVGGPVGTAIGGALGSTLGGVVDLITGKNKQEELMQEAIKEQNMNRIKERSLMLNNPFGEGKAMYRMGGELQRLSPDAFEVQAENPGETDSVDMGGFMVDNDEVIKEKPTGLEIYSDDLLVPNSKKSFAQMAKELERERNTNLEKNTFIDKELKNLFTKQQALNGDQGNEKSEFNYGGKKKYNLNGDPPNYVLMSSQNVEKNPRVDYPSLQANLNRYLTPVNDKIPSGIDFIDDPFYYHRNPGQGDTRGTGSIIQSTVNQQPPATTAQTTGGGSGGSGKTSGNTPQPTYQPVATDYPIQKKGGVSLIDLTGVDQKLGKGAITPTPIVTPTTKPNPSPTNAGGPLGEGIIKAAAFIPNINNALTNMPEVQKPIQMAPVEMERVSLEAEKDDVRETQAGTNQAIRNAALQSGQATNAIAASQMSTNEALSKMGREEDRMNQQIANQELATNMRIRESNVRGLNRFQDQVLERDLANKRLRSENLASISNKIMAMGAENQLKELDKKKLQLVAKKYENSGVLERAIEQMSAQGLSSAQMLEEILKLD